MTNILYIVAFILFIGWAIGVFAFAAGSVIYLLLVIALISFVLGLLRRPASY